MSFLQRNELLESAFEKYRQARDLHDTEWKVFYNWGNALLEKANLLMQSEQHNLSLSISHTLHSLEEHNDENEIDDHTKRTCMAIFDEACSKYEAAFKLNPESSEVFDNQRKQHKFQ